MSKDVISESQYYKNTVDKRVLIIGLEPPPFGGVSVHIQRVAGRLSKNNKIQIIDIIKEFNRTSKFTYLFFLAKKLLSFKPNVIYYHVLFLRSGLGEFLILGLFAKLFNKKLILIEHSARFLYKRSRFYKFCLNKFMYLVNQQVLIGLPMLRAYQDNKIILRNYVVESAFVAPDLSYEHIILSHYPAHVHDFLARPGIKILMNASKFGLWDGQDIYGFDFCLKLMRDYVEAPICLIMAVGTIHDQAHYRFVREQIKHDSRIFLLLNCEQELWPLIKRVDIVVRPSRHDTYGISVAESLFFGVPVIASDVTDRPVGCVLFKTGNYKSFKKSFYELYGKIMCKYYCSDAKSCRRSLPHA